MQVRWHRYTLVPGLVSLLAGAAGADEPSRPAGIYLKAEAKGPGEGLVRVPATAVMKIRQTGMLKQMLTSGMSHGDVIAVLDGSRSLTRAPAGPSFRFQLGSGSGASDPFAGAPSLMSMVNGDVMPPDAKSADEFVLVRFKEKGGSREAQVATYGGRSGRTGRGTKDAVPFTTEPLGAHVFRVTPRDPLPPGEYAFYFAGSQGLGGQVWAFGVD